MSKSSSAPTVTLRLKPSRQLLASYVGLHLVAMALLAGLLGWSAELLVVGLLLVGSLIWLYQTALLRFPRSVKGLTWHADGHWSISLAEGLRDATLSGAPFVTPWLIVIRFRSGGGWRSAYTAVICSDSADAEAIRILRIRLLKQFQAV